MTFKKILSISIITVSMLFFSSSAFAASEDVDAIAVVQAATLTVVENQNIDFGIITQGSGASGTITLDASGGATTPSATGSGIVVQGGHSGKLTITSPITSSVTITYPPPDKLNRSGGSPGTPEDEIDISNFASNSTGTSLALTAATPKELHLGGELTIISTQAAGNYQESLTFKINY